MSLSCVPSERPHVKRENAKRGAQCAQLEIKADREEQVIPAANGGSLRDYLLGDMEAKRLRGKAEALAPPVSDSGKLIVGGGEAVAFEPGKYNSANGGSALVYVADTLETPSSISVEASEQPTRALADLGVLQSALDAAQTADARTSLEKMLCHQMSAAHLLALRFLARADDGDMPPVEVARLANTAARLMEVSQASVVTLARTRSIGKQIVVVQHVHQQSRSPRADRLSSPAS